MSPKVCRKSQSWDGKNCRCIPLNDSGFISDTDECTEITFKNKNITSFIDNDSKPNGVIIFQSVFSIIMSVICFVLCLLICKIYKMTHFRDV